MQAFDFINDIAQWFKRFVPEWDLLNPTEGGIRFGPGGTITLLKPGHIYWYWPIIHNVYIIQTRRQTLSISQVLESRDGQTVLVKTVIIYEIDDVEKAIVLTRDHEDTISEVGEKITVKPIMSRNMAQLKEDLSFTNKLNNEVKAGARALLREYGVKVIDGYIASFAKTKVINHEGDGISIDTGDEA